jgi:hypothetical protein
MKKNGAINKYPHLPFRDKTAFALFSFFGGLGGFQGEAGFRLALTAG